MKNTRKRIISAAMAATMTAALCVSGAGAVDASTSNGVQVKVNDHMVQFTDAAVETVNDRTMVPYRAILEDMKAEVGFDAATNTVSATLDGKTVSFVIGGTVMNITENGQTTQVNMDVAPYINQSNGRTYVPVRFLAESFGYLVGYDAAQKTVVIIDMQQMADDMDSKMTIYNKLMQMEQEQGIFSLNIGSDMKMDMTIADESMNATMNQQITGTMELTAEKAGMDLVSQTTSTTVINGESVSDELKQEILMDLYTGVMYTKQDMEAVTLPDGTVMDGDTWMKMDLYSTINQLTGMDYGKLMKAAVTGSGMTMGSLMMDLTPALSTQLTVDSYDQLKGSMDLVADIFGDARFDKTSSAGTDTYTWSFTKADSISLLGKLGDVNEMSSLLSQLTGKEINLLSDINKCDMSMTYSEKDGKCVAYDAKVDVDVKDLFQMAVNSTSTTETVDMDMTISVPGMVNITMDMTGTVKPSTESVRTQPAAGEKVVDMGDMILQNMQATTQTENVAVEEA